MRILVQFEKTGAAKYISHLDLQRTMQRAIRRAGLPVAYSQGFNPHMLISYATALSLGAESRCEVMELTLSQDILPDKVFGGLNSALPSGIKVTSCRRSKENAGSLSSVIAAAGYEVKTDVDCSEIVKEFAESFECTVKKRSKKGEKEVDIRPMVHYIACMGENKKIIRMILEHKAQSSLNPDLLMSAIGISGGYSVTRTELFADNSGRMINIWDGEGIL